MREPSMKTKVSREQRALTQVHRTGPGKRTYRGIAISMSNVIPAGYLGHWETLTPVNGSVIRKATLKAVVTEIDYQYGKMEKKKAVEDECRAALPSLVEAVQHVAGLAKHDKVVPQMPATPWHVRPNGKPWGMEYDVMPSPHVVEGSQMAVAEGVRDWHVALLLAMAPELLDTLRLAKHVLEQNGWHLTVTGGQHLWRKITLLLLAAESPAPTEQEQPR